MVMMIAEQSKTMMTEQELWDYAGYLAEFYMGQFAKLQNIRRNAFGAKLAKKLDDYTLGKSRCFHTGIERKRGRTRKKRRLNRFQRRQRRS